MIDFSKVDITYLNEIMTMTQKNVERSELSHLPLFTIKSVEKAKIFVYCHRFLNTIHKLISDEGENDKNSFKKQTKAEIDLTKTKYEIIYNCLMKIEKGHYNSNKYINIINQEILKDSIMNDLIDAFAVLLERTNILSISKTQGFILEGKSKDEFHKIFKGKPPSAEYEEARETEENVGSSVEKE